MSSSYNIKRLGPFKQYVRWDNPTPDSRGTHVWVLVVVTTDKDNVAFGQTTMIGAETLAQPEVLEQTWTELENDLRHSLTIAA